MTHDPICRISKAMRNGECCADDPLFGYPCDCRLITEVRQDMLAKCIEVIDDMVIDTVGNSAATVDQVLDALRNLQEKP